MAFWPKKDEKKDSKAAADDEKTKYVKNVLSGINPFFVGKVDSMTSEEIATLYTYLHDFRIIADDLSVANPDLYIKIIALTNKYGLGDIIILH